jgi:hypothetical protein
MLDALGKNADEVAAALRAQGVQGVPNAVRFLNPIVRYAQGRAGGNPTGVLIDDTLTLTFPDGRVENKPIPQPVRDFLDAFNRGGYPDLILPPDPG